MELPTNDCDGTNPVTSFNLVLSDSLGKTLNPYQNKFRINIDFL